MHLRPLHDRVVVRRIETEEKTSGGIIFPELPKEEKAAPVSAMGY